MLSGPFASPAQPEPSQQEASVKAAKPASGSTAGPQSFRPASEAEASEEAPKQAAGVKLENEAELRKRVQARWDAALKGDFEAAYAFETPEYRKANPKEEYLFRMGRRVARWHVATLKELRYDRADEAEAIVTLEYSFALPGSDRIVRTKGNFSEHWRFSDGTWWRQESRRPLGKKAQSNPSLPQ
jgi:hypothetical protein